VPEFGGAVAAALGREGDGDADGHAGAVGGVVAQAGVAAAVGPGGADTVVAVAAGGIDARERLVERVAAVDVAAAHVEARDLIIGALREGVGEIGRGIGGGVGDVVERLDGEGLVEEGGGALVGDELLEGVGGGDEAVLGLEDVVFAGGDAGAGREDVEFGHALHLVAAGVFLVQLGGEVARAAGASQLGLCEVEIAVRVDDAGDDVGDGAAVIPLGHAEVGAGEADVDEGGAEAGVAQEWLGEGDAGEGAVGVGKAVAGVALVFGVGADVVGHAPGEGADEGEAGGGLLGDVGEGADAECVGEVGLLVAGVFIRALDAGIEFAVGFGEAGARDGAREGLHLDGVVFGECTLHRLFEGQWGLGGLRRA